MMFRIFGYCFLILLTLPIVACSDAVTTDDELHTVTFDANGGEFNDEKTKTIEVDSGEYIAPPPEPTKSNYVLEGWFRNDEGNDPWNFNRDTVDENLHFLQGGLR